MTLGYRVFTEVARPSAELVARLAEFDTPDLADAMQKSGVVDGGIRPIYLPMSRFAGPALTVSLPTGSYLVKKVALDLTRAGDVLVLAARGLMHHALLGGSLGMCLKRRGVAGAVVDGAVRDFRQHQEVGFPLFARGLALNSGPEPGGPGEINVPVAFGGCVVFPGDIIVADEEGIVVVPPAHAQEILSRVARLKESHVRSRPILERGEIVNSEPARGLLVETGGEFINAPWGK